MKESNVLSLLGVCSKEDVHSNLFKYCIDHSPQFRHTFLHSVLNWPADVSLTSVNTRISLAGCIPDIVLAGKKGNSQHLGIVEVKLHAGEGYDQTTRYASEACLTGICEYLSIRTLRSRDLVFLTLYPEQKALNKAFRSLCMRSLLAELLRKPITDNTTAALLLSDWTECMGEFYGGGQLLDSDSIADKLLAGTQLESGFLAFQAFFRDIKIFALKPGQPWRGNPMGHPYYGIQFRKNDWAPEEMRWDKENKKYDWNTFDALKHFNIHIELQLDRSQSPSDAQLRLFVHYETNGYSPNLQSLVDKMELRADALDAHMERRDVFKDSLMGRLPSEFRPSRRNAVHQVTSAEYPLSGLTVSKARESISGVISKTAVAVDWALKAIA